MPEFRDALLRGKDHERIGVVSLIAEGPAAIAISRGGAKKTYAHTDPNEDAALFVLGEAGVLAAVADGHHGARGALAAIETLREKLPPRWLTKQPAASTPAEWQGEAIEALRLANHAVLVDGAERRLPPAPTTLGFALLRPAEGLALIANLGDSLLYTIHSGGHGPEPVRIRQYSVDDERVRARSFLGYEAQSTESLREQASVTCVPLEGLTAIVAVTDGLSEYGIGVEDPAAATLEVVRRKGSVPEDRRAAEIARSIADVALAAHATNHSGDNVACAVILPAI